MNPFLWASFLIFVDQDGHTSSFYGCKEGEKNKQTKINKKPANPVHTQKINDGSLFILEIALIFLDRLHTA